MTTRLPQASAADSSKALKSALRAAFPGTKFSVQLSRGTGYGNVHIRWTDGPTTEEVEAISKPFEGRGFDGSTDSTLFHETRIEIGGAPHRSGLGLILHHRKLTEEGRAADEAKAAEKRAADDARWEAERRADAGIRQAVKALPDGVRPIRLVTDEEAAALAPAAVQAACEHAVPAVTTAEPESPPELAEWEGYCAACESARVRYPNGDGLCSKHREPETVRCTSCGAPTPMTGTKLCDACWERERHGRPEPAPERTESVDGRQIRSADDPERCVAFRCTAHGDRVQCFERRGHGGSHYAEDPAGRSFMWADAQAPEPHPTEADLIDGMALSLRRGLSELDGLSHASKLVQVAADLMEQAARAARREAATLDALAFIEMHTGAGCQRAFSRPALNELGEPVPELIAARCREAFGLGAS